MLEGKCMGDLYPLPSLGQGQGHQISEALATTTPSSLRWYDRLGHPSLATVQSVVKESSLPCPVVAENICDA
jgi:hypothetical protein